MTRTLTATNVLAIECPIERERFLQDFVSSSCTTCTRRFHTAKSWLAQEGFTKANPPHAMCCAAPMNLDWHDASE